MKTKRSLWLMAAMMLSVGLVSCSDDKDEPKNEPNQPVVGENFDIFQDLTCDEMVFVEGGTFMMGATAEQGDEARYEELPVHEVTLSDFWIGKYEVTQELWEYVMGFNPSEFTGSKYLPVENVSWLDCMDFISRLNDMTGKKFRLPTEAEWEYAARGGQKNKGYKYSGSNKADEVAWNYANANKVGIDSDDYGTHQVGEKLANELGLYDMSGNVVEWTGDWYNGNYYSVSPSINPTGPIAGEEMVIRGGSWRYNSTYCRVSYRESKSIEYNASTIGLRLVCEK